MSISLINFFHKPILYNFIVNNRTIYKTIKSHRKYCLTNDLTADGPLFPYTSKYLTFINSLFVTTKYFSGIAP